MKQYLIKLIHQYRRFSSFSTLLPLIAVPQCKFHPTCSEYAMQSIEKYGISGGSIKTLFRIIRCSPLSRGGVDLP